MTDIDIDINKLTVTHWHWILDLVSWPLNELGTNWELKYRHGWKWLTVREWNWTTFTMVLDVLKGHFKAQNISTKSLSIFLFWITFDWNFQQIVKKIFLRRSLALERMVVHCWTSPSWISARKGCNFDFGFPEKLKTLLRN